MNYGNFPTPHLSPTDVLIRLESAENAIRLLSRRVADLESKAAAADHAAAQTAEWVATLARKLEGMTAA